MGEREISADCGCDPLNAEELTGLPLHREDLTIPCTIGSNDTESRSGEIDQLNCKVVETQVRASSKESCVSSKPN